MSLLHQLNSSELLTLLIVSISVVGVASIPISVVALCQWRKLRDRECVTMLTEGMLSQEFSAQDMERVLRATGSPDNMAPLKIKHAQWCRSA